ncbi:SpoIIE family protein phosphatase [Streptomyces fuscigenes]|uniref:SpoIIE family protein phosphatase n=1 Tax=Streptomyces fuscigenes TaxID=1528880 RepID=UPI001F408721|nr:SpoIIE family protein phosphatase [Streptomyces fuscigenes]MCF3960095.1 SpoIIE family protein phosphatase [Streptomyces fuscigenes]
MAPNRGGGVSGEVRAALLEVLFTQAPVALLIVDTELRVRRVNTASDGIQGSTADDLVGRPVVEVINAMDTEDVEDMARTVLSTGAPVLDRLVSGRPTAEPHTEHVYSLSVFRLQESNGDVLGAVFSVIDVTEREQELARGAVRDAARKKIADSLDMVTICRELTEVTVPNFADTAMADVLDAVVRGDEPPLGPLLGDEPMRRTAFTSSTGLTQVHMLGETGRFPYPTPYTQSLNDLEPRLITLDETTSWLAADPERGRALREAGVHGMIVAPLVVRGAVLGITAFYRSARTAPFTADDVVLASDLAAFTAVCLDNARRFTREHTVALTLQRRLLPQGHAPQGAAEVVHFHRPAEASGGWFDAIPLSGARLALTVGHVAGRGIHAATAMGQLRAAINALAALDPEPDELLARLNDTVIRLAAERSALPPADPMHAEPLTASCTYVVYDPATGDCAIACADHPPPVLVRPDGIDESPEVPHGPPLGGEHEPFAAARTRLPAGSVLALYNDGLSRAYGDTSPGTARDRLREVLSWRDRTLKGLRDEAVYSVKSVQRPEDEAVLLLARTRILNEDQIATWDVPPDPGEVARARDRAVRQLEEWGLTGNALATELIVSELVTNAIRHGAPPVQLRLIRDRFLTCEVSDTSPAAPHLRHARTLDESGRGLFIVAQLAQQWGTRYTGSGKTIWTEQSLSPGQAAPDQLP